MKKLDDSNIKTLHPIEKKIIKSIKNKSGSSINSLKISTDLNIDQIRRGLEWLKFKNLISSYESQHNIISLGTFGIKSINDGLPERRLLETIKDGYSTISEILKTGKVTQSEINIAVFKAKTNKWIQIKKDEKTGANVIEILEDPKFSSEEALLQKIYENNILSEHDLSSDELTTLEILKKRPQFVMLKKSEEFIRLTEEGERVQSILESEKSSLDSTDGNYDHSLTSDMLVSGKWKNIVFRPLDVESNTPLLFPGRTNPLIDLIEEIREAFVSLGFVEIEGNYIQSSFWNFDALFTPQDHAAREMQDTFYLRFEKNDGLENRRIVRNVSEAHKKGWNYEWKTSEARRAVLRTHTTPVTLQYLAKKNPVESKLFTIGRVFRNEKVSYKHLVEFHQIEGVVTGHNISLRDLMGIQLEFYKKIGITKVKFWPTFFPYTEPSLQSMIYNERLDKWIELFGMGIFRPEVIEPLGIKNPVLAWGGGIERIAMLKYNLSDVRDLYNNNLGWLRGVQKFQL